MRCVSDSTFQFGGSCEFTEAFLLCTLNSHFTNTYVFPVSVWSVFLSGLSQNPRRVGDRFGLQDSDEVAFGEVVFGVVGCA